MFVTDDSTAVVTDDSTAVVTDNSTVVVTDDSTVVVTDDITVVADNDLNRNERVYTKHSPASPPAQTGSCVHFPVGRQVTRALPTIRYPLSHSY